ncbi:cation transport protein-domain-containing protein [Phellopilus nigrolimitatus]|nr:cation transport protein-domain-containing protein [Phellopilus nigrolimitatus]
MANLWSTIQNNLNFFRVHVLFFTFTPLIFSGIFYAANGEIHISYIDALFNCASAAFVCGLASVDLSSLTGFQQGLLFFQACIGSPVVVSWVMVYMRRRYFAKRFEHIVEAEIAKRKALAEQQGDRPPGATDSHGKDEKGRGGDGDGKKKPGIFNRKTLRNLRTDMIRRMDDAPRPIDPNGWITQPQSPEPEYTEPEVNEKANGIKGIATPVATDDSAANSSSSAAPILARTSTIQPSNTRSGVPLGHTLTVEFKTPDREFRGRRPSYIDNGLSTRSRSDTGSRRYSTSMDVVHDDRDFVPPGGVPLTRRTTTMHTARSQRSVPAHSAINRGYGGFPHPHVLLLRLVKRFFPSVERRFLRTVTLPRTQTFMNAPSQGPSGSVNAEGGKTVQYISFDAIVGRNSKFHLLTEEHLQELGGVEYRALTALLWIVGGYHFCVQLMAFTVIAPYISLHRWRSTFEPPNLHRYVPPPWFAAFQVVSAYTNAGMSLVDQSMVPFQKAYPMVLVMALLILAGNTAFSSVLTLRKKSWIITKLVPYRSRINETLHFLLDHPRRCFIYLFPSHQTWFLLTVLVMLNGTDWFFFLVLDIGNSTFATVPLGVRFIIGLLQATCVRAAGFATVTLSSLAPAVQALYVMMMYISIL